MPDATSMALASLALVVYCVLAAVLVRRVGARAGSGIAWAAWFLVAFGLYALLLA